MVDYIEEFLKVDCEIVVAAIPRYDGAEWGKPPGDLLHHHVQVLHAHERAVGQPPALVGLSGGGVGGVNLGLKPLPLQLPLPGVLE